MPITNEERSEEERTIATVSYVPPLFAVFWLMKRWRSNYFTRYHMLHALLIHAFNLLVILAGMWGSIWLSGRLQFQFSMILLTGVFISVSLLVATLVAFYCAFQAARGLFVVLPGLTQLYYLLFDRRLSMQPMDKLIPFQPSAGKVKSLPRKKKPKDDIP